MVEISSCAAFLPPKKINRSFFGLRSLSFSAVPLSLFMTAAYYISSPSARNGDFVILYVIYSSGPHRAYPLIFYVHICSSQIVFLSNFRCVITAHTAKCFLMLSYPITPAINTFSRYFVCFHAYLYPDRFTQQNQLHLLPHFSGAYLHTALSALYIKVLIC